MTVDVEGGPTLRQSKVARTKEVNNELLLRPAANIDWAISDTTSFSNDTIVLMARDKIEVESATGAFGRDNSETKNASALDMQIIGNLAARLSLEVTYRSSPPPDGKATETLGKVSLVHSF